MSDLSTSNPQHETWLGRYRIERRLGLGGMAEVFLASHVGAAGFERTVCLKRIRPELAGDSGFRQLFMREAVIAGRLSHANLVQFHDCIEADDTLALVMELVDGMDLRALIRRLQRIDRATPETIVAYIAGQLLCGLRYAHARRVIHRDISPHNILVSQQGEVKLADFGVAKAMRTHATITGDLKGKLAYMSPEQAKGGHVDHRTDLYSCGLILYELLTARRFFPKVSHKELFRLVRGAPRPHVEDVSDELTPFIEGLLQPDPDNRLPSAEAALEALPRWPSTGPLGALELSRFLEEIQLELATTVRQSFTILLSNQALRRAAVEPTESLRQTRPSEVSPPPVISSSPTSETRSRQRPALEDMADRIKTETDLFEETRGRELHRARRESRRLVTLLAILAIFTGALIGVSGGLVLTL